MSVFYREIQEFVVDGKRLGRHVMHDSRSWEFQAETATKLKTVNHASNGGLPLDQGNVGACTGFSTCGALDSAPDAKPGKKYTDSDAMALYALETRNEGQPYPTYDPGGTGLLVCSAAKELGWITKYTHTFSLDSALKALVLRPVITGVNWYTSFDSPSSAGLVEISADATVRGGHEFCVYGLDVKAKLVWAWNSWGKSWGKDGKFCFSFDTWGQLLSAQGDVTVPVL